MAEIELNGQCLNRRIDDIEVVSKEVLAWQKYRNNKNAKVKLKFGKSQIKSCDTIQSTLVQQRVQPELPCVQP